MIQFYTYIYKDPSKSMEPFWIGKGKNKRAWVHLKRKDHHPLTYKIQKMLREGIEPIIEITNRESEKLAFLYEKFLIAAIGRKDKGYGPLLNMTDGGEGYSGGEGCSGQDNGMFGIERPDLAEWNRINRTGKTGKDAPRFGKKDLGLSERMKGNSYALGQHYKREIVPCPYCDKSGDIPNMTRWHFENCKERGIQV